jgi:hypothetical protein
MTIRLLHIALLSLINIAVMTTTAAADEPGRNSDRSTSRCLLDVVLGRSSLSECYGLASGGCINEIVEAGGNLGIRAGSVCSQIELTAWYGAWAWTLEEALWGAENSEVAKNILAQFAEIQAQAAGRCLRISDPYSLSMKQIAQCVGEIYGPFLVENLRSRR